MTRKSILKSVSILALTSGLFLTPATAQYHRGGLDHAVGQVERATDSLFNEYKRELQHCGLWKPRGAYSTLYSATFRMEEYGDALREYYERRAGLAAMARVAAKIDSQVHLAQDVAAHLRISPRIHAALRRVEAATHELTGFCRGGGGYDDDYRAPRGRGRGHDDHRGHDHHGEHDHDDDDHDYREDDHRGHDYGNRDPRRDDRYRRPVFQRPFNPFFRF